MSLHYEFANFRLLPNQRALWCGEASVKLGSRAFDMLLALLERRDRVVSKNELMDLVWPRLVVEENNLQVQVVALRKLLGHPAIATVPGRGYRFTLPVVVQGDVAAAAIPSPTTAPLAQPGASPRHNLPPWLPRLFGREDDLSLLGALLDQHTLVTVTGSGGIGKTRLAQAAATARLDRTPDGLWWVDLAAITDPDRVADAVALAMGLRPPAGQAPADALQAALAAGAPLLVLDNAEHLLDAVVALITRLRTSAPQARWLVTSQEVLRVADEYVFRVGPLALPGEGQPTAQVIAQTAAVALFVSRAQAADRHFVLGPDNQRWVAEICRRLDGIPLAIELAAARLPLLGVQGLHQKLDQRLKVLTTGDRNAQQRHHTLRAALEWSHQLLAAPEQSVLHRLGVFAGGFTLEAAQQVAEDEHDIDRWEVLEHLGALVEKSLVVAEGDAPPRYRMLETMRLFALERLIESGQARQARHRHREHYLALAEEAQPRMLVGDARGLASLDRERDNLFLALAWPDEDPAEQHGLRLAAAMRYYWTSRGLHTRGLQTLLEVLARPGSQAASVTRCIVQATAAQLHGWTGNHEQALHQAQEAQQAARTLGQGSCLCLTLSALGFIHIARNEAPPALEAALESLALGQQLGDGHELGNALALMAAVHHLQGQPEQALALLEQGVALRQRLNQPWSEAMGHLNLVQLAVNRGQAAGAGHHLQRVLDLLPRVDSQHVGLHLIGMAAEWAAAIHDNETSVLLDAACVAQYGRVGMEDRLDAPQVQRLEAARQALGAARCLALQTAGQDLGYAEALEQVRDFLARRGASGLQH